jgi:hypothetical protein
MEGHLAVAFVAKLPCTHTGTGTPRCIECMHLAVGVHQSKEIATHAAEVWSNDGHCRIRRQRSVYCVTTQGEHVHAGLSGRAIGAGDNAEA